jgi:hypothetical protein
MKRASLICIALVAFAVALAVACSDQVIATCFDIPEGGCPSQEGVACQDPTCAAAYNCEPDGGWSLAYACPAFDGSAQDAQTDSGANDAETFDVNIDAPPGAFGGPGCEDLEQPDCPLGEAIVCEQQSGNCCDCEDLWICDDGGWDPWGECTDDGGISAM